MKILFVSDIHGSSYYAKKLKEIYFREQPDDIVVLGDLYYHGPRNELTEEYDPMKVADILNALKRNLYVIKGNCDAEVDEMISEFAFYDSLLLDLCGKKIFCTHGHKYNISKLPNEDFDIMAYGHFHTGFIKKDDDGHIFINPGSISLPKGSSVNSYIVMDDYGIFLKDINGKIIEKFNREDLC